MGFNPGFKGLMQFWLAQFLSTSLHTVFHIRYTKLIDVVVRVILSEKKKKKKMLYQHMPDYHPLH